MDDLTDLASVKAYAGIATDVDDAVIASLITAYSGFVRAYCNRDFTAADYSRAFDGRNHTRQMLPQYPVLSVASVQIGTVAVSAQASFGQPGYRFDDKSVILDGFRFACGEANVLIAWRAGYESIPAEIAQAVNEMVGLRYSLRDKQGWASKSLAGETVSLITKSMPDSAKVVLDNYRAVVPL